MLYYLPKGGSLAYPVLSGSIFTWQQILRMTVPYVLDSLSIMLIGMLITALISKNGETSVAAVSLVGPITNLVVCMFNGIGAGGTWWLPSAAARRTRNR